MIVRTKIVKKLVFGSVVGIIKIILSDPQRNARTRQKKKKFKDQFFALGNHRNFDNFFYLKKPEYDAP